MRVLHVLQSTHFSGAENVVCQIIKMFENDKDIEMAYTSQDGSIRSALEERNITFFPMKELCHKELKNVVNNFKPDVIHGHDIRGSIEASRFAGSARIIHTIHGNDLRMRKLSSKSVLYYASALKASHIFWVSKTCLNEYYFYNRVKGKSSILYNVIDTQSVLDKCRIDLNTYNYDAIFIGRIAYPKNPQRLVSVFAKVVEKNPNFKAAIVGTGDLEDTTKKIVDQYGIQNNVDFLGFLANPYKVLSDSKIMVMTSDWEGTPIVALEALALGKPIVSTPTDGMCDIVENGVNGFCEHSEELLADRIIQLLSDHELYEKFCAAQRKKSIEINNTTIYKKRIGEVYGIQ